MRLKTTRKQYVDEVAYGVYVWCMPDGRMVGDDEGHFLMIRATRGDRERIQRLTDAMRDYGVTEGYPKFMSGHRPVTDEEYEEQKQRMKWGLTPDPLDIAAIDEEMRNDYNRR